MDKTRSWGMKTGRERYHNDHQFRVLVDQMAAHIFNEDYTPSEMRDAAMTASIIVEQQRIPPIYTPGAVEEEIHRLRKVFPEYANKPTKAR